MNISPTAIHEVAHAYTGHMLGSKVLRIEMKSDEVGCVDFKHVEDVIVIACVLIAGHEAEVLWCNRDEKMVPADDFETLEEIGVKCGGANIIREPLIEFLKGNKDIIMHLAKILEEKKVLKGRAFIKLVAQYMDKNNAN